jgi:hypothetical protein
MQVGRKWALYARELKSTGWPNEKGRRFDLLQIKKYSSDCVEI